MNSDAGKFIIAMACIMAASFFGTLFGGAIILMLWR